MNKDILVPFFYVIRNTIAETFYKKLFLLILKTYNIGTLLFKWSHLITRNHSKYSRSLSSSEMLIKDFGFLLLNDDEVLILHDIKFL